ncbi:EamA-like transporter family protein [Chromohalobacter marismortui]|uniref:EamA-like transporter family protein n=1 Tax=Chromohalobacter marismortui TaxID=42055 RepID=A0A4R7NLZ0_9GAMM|nr:MULTISPECIES: DMT family transporter [Chromohalobacter]MCI0510200.1 DMT family transporter [Chromohalobacter sp.]MCI0593376.1 DMT family transporter [Chromohalobacter sp.]TDU21618.1 EamA-like transporter family protein [Chromohalobacter marismortui]
MKPIMGTRASEWQGLGCIVVSVFCLSMADALVKYISDDVGVWQLYMLRALLASPLLGVLLGRRGVMRLGRALRHRWVLVRTGLLMAMWLTFYAALPTLTLSMAAVALYTSPLFIALFAAWWAGERLSAGGWWGIALGFAGVVLILRPGTSHFTPTVVLPLLAAVCYALACVVTRVHCRDEAPLVLSGALNVGFLGMGVAGCIGVTLFAGVPVHTTSFLTLPWQSVAPATWGVLGGLAVLFVLASSTVAKAYQIAPAALIGVFDYAYLVFAAGWSWWLFEAPPDMPTVLGMACVGLAGGLVWRCGAGRVHADSALASRDIAPCPPTYGRESG